MSIKRQPLRYAHSEGHTDLCYSEDGRQMITCGSDGDIRIWAGIDDPDPESYCVGEGAFSVAQKGDNIFTGRDDGRVMMFTYPGGERNGSLTRFNAIVTHITVTKNDSLIACASEDFSVKLFTSFQDVNCSIFNDLKGPALGVEISPDAKVLVASCGDGKIYIWNISDNKLIKTIDCVPRCNSFTSAKILCRVSFNSDGKYFAYPKDKEIIITNTKQFEQLFTLSSDQIQSPFSIVKFSLRDNFIAASTTTGEISIWKCEPESRGVISTHEQKYNICALAWNPEDSHEISFCDNNGQIGTLEFTHDENFQSQVEVNSVNVPDLEDEDDENVISLEKIKNDTLRDINVRSPAADSMSDVTSRPQTPERPKTPPCSLQPPFQPSSTPTHLTQRFMLYNDIGIVRLYNDELEASSIDVQFHDATFYKNLFMKNHLNHTMAALSDAVLALACEVPSKLVCIPLRSGTREWSTELTDLEEILCVAASSSLVAIASNVRMLRIFSIFGTQRGVISIPGPVVSATAYKNYIFVVYHACTAQSEDHNLAGMLVELNAINITSKFIPISITPRSFLTWIGFTDVGSLAIYDSAGILRICKLNSGAWVPVCDTSLHAKGASDSYFLTFVSEMSQTLRVIHCKGTIYPAATPLPIPLELPMQLQICEIETDKAQFEDKLFRWAFFETDQPEKTFKETAIKLFALACRNNLDERAFEILEILNTPQLVNIALKYANKLGKHRLVEKLTELLRKIQGETIISQREDISIRPALHRSTNKPRPESSSQDLESQSQNYTQELFTNTSLTGTSMMDDSQFKDESMTQNKKLVNPFLKKSCIENKRNPLSLTNPADVPLENTFTNQTNKKTVAEKPNQENKSGRETFNTWFNKHKPELEKQHSELSDTDLVKLAMKMYKSQAEKRKATDDEENNPQKAKQSKLSAFAFSKH